MSLPSKGSIQYDIPFIAAIAIMDVRHALIPMLLREGIAFGANVRAAMESVNERLASGFIITRGLPGFFFA